MSISLVVEIGKLQHSVKSITKGKIREQILQAKNHYKCKIVLIIVCTVWSRENSPRLDMNRSGFQPRLFSLKTMTLNKLPRFSEPEFRPVK